MVIEGTITFSSIQQTQGPTGELSTTPNQDLKITQTPSSTMEPVGREQKPSETNTEIKLTQQGKTSLTTVTALELLKKSLSSGNEQVGDENHIQQLNKVLSNPEIDKTTRSKGATSTAEKTSGHPHLEEPINKAIQTYFNPEPKEVDKEASEQLVNAFNSRFADKNGDINFEALGLDKRIIKKAGIKGKVFVKEDGSFDFKVSGKCSNEAVKCMTKLKDKLEEINHDLKVPINIHPATVGPLSVEDQAALANGGQIQYRTLPDGGMMKLTLDPGSNGENDGLTIGFYSSNNNALELQFPPQKIKLKYVFEGAELNGKKVGPFLKDWRKEKLFENSAIHREVGLFGRERKTNENDKGRIQTQNELWNAVFEYLKASVENKDEHIDASNISKESDTQSETAVTEKSPKSEYTVEESNQSGKTADTNNLNIDLDDMLELSGSTSANFATTVAAEPVEITDEVPNNTIVTEETTQQQAKTNHSLENNFDVTIDTKTSSTQSNGIDYTSEDIINFGAGGINVDINSTPTSADLENATTISENHQGSAEFEGIKTEQVVVNDNKETTENKEIDEHFKLLDKEFEKIKNNLQPEECKDIEIQYQNYKATIKAYANMPKKGTPLKNRFQEVYKKLSSSTQNSTILDATNNFSQALKNITQKLYSELGFDLKAIDNYKKVINEFKKQKSQAPYGTE